eukprot:scaffold2101_cov127-Cylindrotheca_fusiformis.AAC.3
MCVDRPARYVRPMRDAGANLFIFQWEAVSSNDEALELAHSIVDAGMECGISINPSTDIDDVIPLLASGLVTVVDVLAVAPGFGGQQFQAKTTTKITTLLKLKDENIGPTLEIMVDGGINATTAARVAEADVLVSGTFLFNHPHSLAHGIAELTAAVAASRKEQTNGGP